MAVARLRRSLARGASGGAAIAGQGVYIVSQNKPPPDNPTTLNQIIRLIAGFGGSLNRTAGGLPSPHTIWIGLQRTKDFTLAIESQRRALDPGCG